MYDQLEDIVRMLTTLIRNVAENASLCNRGLQNGQTILSELMMLRIHFNEKIGNLLDVEDSTESDLEDSTTESNLSDWIPDVTNAIDLQSDKGLVIVMLLTMLQLGLVVSVIIKMKEIIFNIVLHFSNCRGGRMDLSQFVIERCS